jgi:hypothetical protein
MHVGNSGKVKASLFSHAATNGCSIQREGLLAVDEAKRFVEGFLKKNPTQDWRNVVIASCAAVRSIQLDGKTERLACVYDTANPDNPAHAEIFWTGRGEIPEAGEAELRRKLMLAFNADDPVLASAYRAGMLRELAAR